MADQEKPAEDVPGATAASPDDDDDELTPGYTAPKQVDLKTLQELDADDEALVKYKQTLLGQTEAVKDEGGSNVILQELIFAPVDHKEVKLDLRGDLSKLKDSPITIKEGVQYRLKIQFRVQREIVAGLRYFQSTYRKGVRVDKSPFMVGSYGPKTDPHVYQTPIEDAPSGMLFRGNYSVKSKFTDDDKKIYLEWEWAFHVKKEWDS